MSACPHTGNPDKCTCRPGCGCPGVDQAPINERAANACQFHGHRYVGQSNCVYCATPQHNPT